MKRKIAAILAADVAGYSRLVAEDEEDTLRRLADAREVFDAFVVRSHGRIFNTAGDSVMCEFESAVEAVRCAIDIQESLRTRNLPHPPAKRLLFRIGITIGDVVERGTDLLGDGVNIAARLESLASPGGICISRSVHEAVANKISVPFRDIGQKSVKNIPQPVHAFVVDWSGKGGVPEQTDIRVDAAQQSAAPDGSGSIPPEKQGGSAIVRPARRMPSLLTISAAAALVVAIGVGAILFRPMPDAPRVNPPSEAGLPDDPAEAFAQLARQGGIVARPRSAVEFYHNARTLEARGDQAGARRAYQAFADLGVELLDPHLRYAALLRVDEGRAGAREAYARIVETRRTKAAALVHALQFDGVERRARIEAFAAANPDFAPADYLLADEYSAERLGTQTLTDRRLEYEALDRFLEADAQGRLAAFFLDRSVLSGWLDGARRRKDHTEGYFRTAQTRPTASFTRSNQGWIAAIALPEPATALSYRIGEAGQFRSTGQAGVQDPRTGKPMPLTTFELPPDLPRTPIYVAYEDAAGRSAGPFPISFDPQAALVAGQKDVLERFPNAWLAFRQDIAGLLYYTHLVSNRCAIAKVEIGLDGGPVDREVALPPCDPRNPYAIPADTRPYLTIPPEVRSVSARITYADGAVSDVQSFRRQ